ncbi:serine/threonine-protein phosphatase 7 long form homolog [Aegilops tauschii subsp. strangulata]|uniref:serine/threonine-protein phosphatase 7 long form homolog n=1 Tax=Aegilops tauschii subsp. strangulata TaxID=200361 RepID=UPI003CC8A693
MVWLLDDVYDTKHRAYMMREKEMKLEPLKIRYHGVSGPAMPYDERYTPYIKQAGLLPWIQLVSRSMPNLNAPLVSGLADRWRSETHSFHLWTGEMTVTLENVSLITGLAIDGMPLCMSIDSDGWREQMIALIGMAPTEAEADVEEGEEKKKRERKAAGAAFTWIQTHFATCPPDATDDVIQTHARVYMRYVVSRSLFPDSTGKNAPWMWLKELTVFHSKWSWGSATLAYLYRQLDDACCRITDSAGIGGNMLLLSPISSSRPGDIELEPASCAKRAAKEEMLKGFFHMFATKETVQVTPEQVEWQPYGADDRLGYTPEFSINPMCLRDRDLWLMRCPLICNWAVEFHLPHRVFRQFGLFQPHPPEWVDTDKALHRLDRRRQRKIKDWDKHHASYVTRF